MSLNCNEIAAVINSFPCEKLRIRKFHQTDNFTIKISVSGIDNIYEITIGTQSGLNRIYLSSGKSSSNKPTKNNRFAESLNSITFGAVITSVTQLNMSRIVVFDIDKENKKYKLIARLWGNNGNIIITDSDYTIIDLLNRYPNRGEWTDEVFELPENNLGDPSIYPVREIFAGRDINKSVSEHYDNLIVQQKVNSLKNELVKTINQQISGLNQRIDIAKQNLSLEREEAYLKNGDLIKSHISLIKQGDTFADLKDYVTDNIMRVALKPELCPSENAKYYYDKYKKLKKGREQWEQELSGLNERLDELMFFDDQIKKIDKESELTEIMQKVKKTKTSREEKVRHETPGKIVPLPSGYNAIISRSAKEADIILSKVAKGNDYWFHVRDNAGSHVIVKHKKNEELPYNVMISAANLAHINSKSKNEKETDVYFTQVKHLKKGRSDKPGLVFPFFEKNIKSVLS